MLDILRVVKIGVRLAINGWTQILINRGGAKHVELNIADEGKSSTSSDSGRSC